MGAVLRRAAFSPNIKERADCSAALFTAGGELLVQAEHIPVHLGSMPASVRAAIAAVGPDVAARRPGDPQRPVRRRHPPQRRHAGDARATSTAAWSGWAANRAHHADVGGAAPGSMPADATEIQQEGLRLPPVVLTPTCGAVFLANSRTPVERAGDLDAQVGANARRRRAAGRADRVGRARRRGHRLRRAAHAGGAGRAARRRVALRRRARLGRPRPTSSTRSAIALTLTMADGDAHVRLHRHRRAAARQRQRRRGGDRQRRRLRGARRPSTRRSRPTAVLAAADPRRRPARHRRRRPPARPRSAPATSRSASGWPTCASAPSPRPCPSGWAPPGRAR